MKKILLVLFVLFAFLFAPSNSVAWPLEKKIDASSEEKLQESVSSLIKNMDAEEQKRFLEALQTIMFADVNDLSDIVALGQNMEVTKGVFYGRIDGKSADEIIAMADEISAKGQKVEETNVHKNAGNIIDSIENEGKEKTIKELYEETLVAKLQSMKVQERNYSHYIDIGIRFENLSDRNIRGVKGVATFKDIFGDTIKQVKLSMDHGIPAKSVYLYDGSIEINQFDDSAISLAGKDIEKIQFSFDPEIILFESNNPGKDTSESKSGKAVSAEEFLKNR